MIGTRFLIGWGVGIAACVAPIYIQELSPTRLRGRMVVINVVAITFGQVVAYGIDAGFANVHGGWRWMVGLGTIPAGLQLIFLFFLPESPCILLRRGHVIGRTALSRRFMRMQVQTSRSRYYKLLWSRAWILFKLQPSWSVFVPFSSFLSTAVPLLSPAHFSSLNKLVASIL